jgi:S1-C subfamily serine protease
MADASSSATEAAPPTTGRHESTPAELFKEWAPAVVSIGVKSHDGEGGGTGFFVDDSGTIATNHHVIGGATQVRVKLFSGKWVEDVELLVEDKSVDLALLKITTTEPLKSTILGDSDAVVVGERIISIGNPLGLEYTLTDGLVSSRRIFEGRPMIQMSVPVSPGNSGGPLFNLRGEAIGVTTLQVAGGFFGRAQNLNMAGPINTLKTMFKKEYPGRRKFGKDDTSKGTW